MQSRQVLARLPCVRRRIATPHLWAMLEPCVAQPQLLGGSGIAAVPHVRQYSSSVSVPEIKQELLDKLTSVKHGFVSRVDIDELSARVRAALRCVCAQLAFSARLFTWLYGADGAVPEPRTSVVGSSTVMAAQL